MLIPCPHCGPRDSREFTYGGDATLQRPDPDGADDKAWCDYIYARANPMGPHEELWHHAQGCRAWIVVTRDTLTHEITGARPTARWQDPSTDSDKKEAAE